MFLIFDLSLIIIKTSFPSDLEIGILFLNVIINNHSCFLGLVYFDLRQHVTIYQLVCNSSCLK